MPWSERKHLQEASEAAVDACSPPTGASEPSSQPDLADPQHRRPPQPSNSLNQHDFLHKLLQQPGDTNSDAHFQHQLMPLHQQVSAAGSSGESQLQQQMTASNGYPIEQAAFGAQSLSFAMGQLQLPNCEQQHAGPWSSSYSMPIYSPASLAGPYSQLNSGSTADVALMHATSGELQQQLVEAGSEILQPISDNETIFSSARRGFRGRQQHQDSSNPSSRPITYTSAIHSHQQQLQEANIQQQQQRLSSMFALREQPGIVANLVQSSSQQRADFLLARPFIAPASFQAQHQQLPLHQLHRPSVGPSNGSRGPYKGRGDEQLAHLSSSLPPANRQRKNRSPFFMGATGNSVAARGANGNKSELFGGSKPPAGSDSSNERFSRKVFVGGLPPDIDEEEIKASFQRFGSLQVDWPHKIESKSYFPPKGYAFLLFHEESAVQALIDACIQENDKLYLSVSSPTIKDKPVQIRPWRLSDSDFVLDSTLALDPRKTVFVGGVPRPLKASELANIMNNFYGGVCYAGIDTDPELKYPKGAGRVAFSNHQSYISAISGRFIHLHLSEIERRVEVKPYVLDDQFCDECQGARCGNKFAPFFCANVACLRYYCQSCWTSVHSQPGKEFHKPLVKEGADRVARGPTGNQYARWA